MHSFAKPIVAVLDDAELDAVAFGQRDPWLVALADHKHVFQSGVEAVANCILDVHNLKRAWVFLTVGDDADTPNVVSTADHDYVAWLKLHIIENLARLSVQADGVVWLYVRIWVANSSAIVSDTIWNALRAPHYFLDTAELVAGFFLYDFVECKAALGVVKEAKILLCLLNLHHVHEACWEEMSERTLPSTLINRCITIIFTSL